MFVLFFYTSFFFPLGRDVFQKLVYWWTLDHCTVFFRVIIRLLSTPVISVPFLKYFLFLLPFLSTWPRYIPETRLLMDTESCAVFIFFSVVIDLLGTPVIFFPFFNVYFFTSFSFHIADIYSRDSHIDGCWIFAQYLFLSVSSGKWIN